MRGEQELLHGALGLRERALGPRARLARKEIERGDRLEFAPLLLQHARNRARIRLAETDAQAFHRFHQLYVTRAAVEQALEALLLRRCR